MPLALQAQYWAAPQARDFKSGHGKKERVYKELAPQLERGTSKRLNPDWVCHLMGVPVGWVHPRGIRNQTDELRLLGNGVVPATASKAFVTLYQQLQNNPKVEGGGQ